MVENTFITGTDQSNWIKPGEVSTGEDPSSSAIIEKISEVESEDEPISSDGEEG